MAVSARAREVREIVVVGHGAAGLSAALAAAEAAHERGIDAHVRILERAPEDSCGGNSRWSPSNMRMRAPDAMEPGFVDEIVAQSCGRADRAYFERLAADLLIWFGTERKCLMTNTLRRLKQLEEENAKLKRLVADLSLDKAMLRRAQAKGLRPARKRELVDDLRTKYAASIRQACGVMMISRSLYHYRSVAADQAPLRLRIKEIAATRVRYGYKRIYVVLRREGWTINHKRVYRLYKQEDFTLFERRPRRRRSAAHRTPPVSVRAVNECWGMDFVSDQLYDGRKLRALTLIDLFTRECLAISVNQGIRGEGVVATLAAIGATRGVPSRIQVDNVLNAIAAESFGNKHPVGTRWRVDDIKEQVLHNPVVFRSASGGLA
jgi:HTH-like domain/Integrase core domain